MKKLLVILLLAITSACALAQTPTYFITETPKGHIDRVKMEIANAKAAGCEGVAFLIGTNSHQDPNIIDTDLRAAIDYACSLGLRVLLRGLVDVPRHSYSGGVISGNSWWLNYVLTHGGSEWFTPYRPPDMLWSLIAKLDWQPAIDYAVQASAAAGLPKPIFECTNEPSDGGAGGRFIGDSISNAVWPSPFHEGYVEPTFYHMVRVLMENTDFKGCTVIPWTRQGVYGDTDHDGKDDGQLEIDCESNADAKWCMTQPNVMTAFNRYGAYSTSVTNAGDSWQYREGRESSKIAAKWPGVPQWCMEFNLSLNNVWDKTKIAACRMEILKRQRKATNIKGACIFTIYSPAWPQFSLMKTDQSWVGGQVGPLLLN